MKKIILLMIMIITFATGWGQKGYICYRTVDGNGDITYVQCPPQIPIVDSLFFIEAAVDGEFISSNYNPDVTASWFWKIQTSPGNWEYIPGEGKPCMGTNDTMCGKLIMVENNSYSYNDASYSGVELYRLSQMADGTGTVHTDSIFADSVTFTATSTDVTNTFLYWSYSTGSKSTINTVRCTNTLTCTMTDAVHWKAHFGYSTAAISYSGSPWCTTITETQAVTLIGSNGGTYFSTDSLSLDTTGQITPSTSTPGTYTVTYIVPNTGGCITSSTPVTITAPPTASISYTGSPWCNTASAQSVTLIGTNAYTGGTYSSGAGLTLNTTTGQITPSTSTSGNYTISYIIPASGGCPADTISSNITITEPPTNVSISCPDTLDIISGNGQVILNGTDGTYSYMGGTYFANGLTIDSDGTINPITPGTYTVTYTIPATGGCSEVTVTDTVTIITTQSISENESTQTINLYPNPAESIINFDKGEFFIFDFTGKMVMNGNTSSADVSNLNAGTYLFRSGNKSMTFIKK